MSKSLGNSITLGSEEKEISLAVKKMYTDSNHLRVEDPGTVEGNTVFTYLDAFHPDEIRVQQLKDHYRSGGLGDSKLKNILEENLQDFLRPIRQRRTEFLSDKAELMNILKAGTHNAKTETAQVVHEVKAAFGLDLFR
jgi:tryptophanyl-tRNA synthetase